MLEGADQAAARAALAGRLGRMNAKTLIDYLRQKDPEVRRAAAVALGAKDKATLPEFAAALIRSLADESPAVVQAARMSLKALSGLDHGPEVGAKAGDRLKAFTAWQAWWAAQNK